MSRFIASKITYPNKISAFGILYLCLRFLGTDYMNGAKEKYFARLRAALLNGLANLEEPINLSILEAAFKQYTDEDIYIAVHDQHIKNERDEDILRDKFRESYERYMKDVNYDALIKALEKGIDESSKDRSLVLTFVTEVTKQYVVLEAVLQKVDFLQEKEFQVIYGNFSRQSTDSKEKRKKLAEIRLKAIEILTEQIKNALENLEKSTIDTTEKETKIKELSKLYQDNLIFVSNYMISDDILEILLKELSFKDMSAFRIFFKNLVTVSYNKNLIETRCHTEYEMESEAQRQRIVDWIKVSGHKAFIQQALSYVFTYEKSDDILKDILAFLSEEATREEGLGKIELNIPESSLNYDRYSQYDKKREAQNKKNTTILPVVIGKEERKICKQIFEEDIVYLGIKTVVASFSNPENLAIFTQTVNNAIRLGHLTEIDKIEEIKREVAKFDWKIAQKIKSKPITGISSVKIVREEESSKEEDQKFKQVAQAIIDSQAGIKR